MTSTDTEVNATRLSSKPTPAPRRAVRFPVGGEEIAAWHYPGTNGACVVMAGGLAVTKEPATDKFAARLNAAGYGVLAFDYRHLGESGGAPRQVVRVGEQITDWEAAIAYAAALPGVDPGRVAVWGFSASGGHIVAVAARSAHIAAAIAQTPNVGGFKATSSVTKYQTTAASLRVMTLAIRDAFRGLVGRTPLLVPLDGAPGETALITTPDAADTLAALNPGDRHPDWIQKVAARTLLRMVVYRPGRLAHKVRSPLLVMVCDNDKTAFPPAAIAAAGRAPNAELVRLSGGHYAPFLAEHEQAVAAQLDFLDRHVLGAAAERG